MIDLRKPVRASPGRGRRVGLVLGLLALAVLAIMAGLAIGTKAIAPDAVWGALWHPAGTRGRHRRECAAAAAHGARPGRRDRPRRRRRAEGHTRNPLADPGLLGVTAGAAFRSPA